MNALFALTERVSRLDKGQFLRYWETDTVYHDLTKKDIRSARARFATLMKEIKNYLRVSKKKSRDTVPPESLKGTYTPVFAGKALTTFFTSSPKNFGSVNPLAWKQEQPQRRKGLAQQSLRAARIQDSPDDSRPVSA